MTGQKPDFLCEGPIEAWIEVKSSDDAPISEREFDTAGKIRTGLASIKGNGSLFAYISPDVTDRDIRFVLTALKKATEAPIDKDSELLIVAQSVADQFTFKWVQFETFTRTQKRVRIITNFAPNHRGSLPPGYEPDSRQHILKCVWSDGSENSQPFGAVCGASGGYRLALGCRYSDKKLNLFMHMPTEAMEIPTRKKVRRLVNEGNSQFKNALNYRKAPSVLFYFDETLFADEGTMVVSGLFGDLKVTWPLHGGTSEAFLDGNAAFTPAKNRSTSAFCYFYKK